MPHSFANNRQGRNNMRVLILTSLIVTIILAFHTTDAEEDDISLHFHLTPGDGEPEEEEESAKKEDGADYIGNGRTSKFTPSLGLIRL